MGRWPDFDHFLNQSAATRCLLCYRRPVADEGADILCPSVERLSVRDVNMDGSCLQALAQVTACTMQSSLRRIYIVHI